MSFKDKVEGNELDLSLNELTEVPVKLLVRLNINFAKFVHYVFISGVYFLC